MPILWYSAQAARHGLDDVVAVVVGGPAEQVERPAGTAGAAHLDAHGCESEERRDNRADDRRGIRKEGIARRGMALQRVDQAVRPRHAITRVFDDRRERPVGEGLSRRQSHRCSQQDPVAHAHVVQPTWSGCEA